MGTPDYKNTTIPYDTVGCILFDCNRLIVAFRRLVSEAPRIQVLELGIEVMWEVIVRRENRILRTPHVLCTGNP